mmetsp:Transcript_45054/g.115227  ORF Transcript_45054/g.115227 Transcript_45054/m.115227 type:complete len:233 (-) Transcript_45054:895-1593(-)
MASMMLGGTDSFCTSCSIFSGAPLLNTQRPVFLGPLATTVVRSMSARKSKRSRTFHSVAQFAPSTPACPSGRCSDGGRTLRLPAVSLSTQPVCWKSRRSSGSPTSSSPAMWLRPWQHASSSCTRGMRLHSLPEPAEMREIFSLGRWKSTSLALRLAGASTCWSAAAASSAAASGTLVKLARLFVLELAESARLIRDLSEARQPHELWRCCSSRETAGGFRGSVPLLLLLTGF